MQPQSVLTQPEAYIIAAFVGACAALLVVIVRDVLIEGRKERRLRKREFIDRKLTNIYSPLWVALGGEDEHLGNILGNAELRARIGAHFHLLSPDLRDILGRSFLIGRLNGDSFRVDASDLDRMLELSPAFKRALKSDLDRLQSEFAGV